MTVLIPAYEPDIRLLKLIYDIKEKCNYNILVVDDGSGRYYNHIFRTVKDLGCILLTHENNKGKGIALKTGFKYLKEIGEAEGVVCADSDGQHLPGDIIRIAGIVKSYKNSIILGCRRFTGKVPLRSRLGNTVTRMVYLFSTGQKIYDTQTGLRGYSAEMFDWLLSIPGERFEYEMKMLLEASKDSYSIHEVNIETVYHNDKSSHFKTLIDSIKVFIPILKFSASSILSAILDFTLLMLLKLLTSNLLLSVVLARVCSSIFNYSLNKFFVFSKSKKNDVKDSMPKYFALAAVVLALNYGLLYTLNEIAGIPLVIAKLMTEGIIFSFSYWSQKKFVFRSDN